MSRAACIVVAGALALGGSVSFAACGGSETRAGRELTVEGAWARTTPPKATNGAAYLTVTSPTDDVIVGVDVPGSVATDAQMHTAMAGDDGGSMANMPGMDHDEEGSMTAMEPLARVDLPAGEAVAFEPGGRHIMLTGLARGLEAGDAFDLTLHFRHARDRTVTVRVAANAP